MKNSLKFLGKRLVPNYLTELRKRNKIGKQFLEWERKGYGYPVPPPRIIKENVVQAFQEKYQYQILIETGTCNGDMVSAQKENFKKIWSIELDNVLYENAVQRFKNDSHIKILHGDSASVLPKLIKELSEPAIFWLDAHYSGGKTAKGSKNTPILEELEIIVSRNLHHVILIDDARSFFKLRDYPTIDFLQEWVLSRNPDYKMEVKDDIIRFWI